MMESSREPDEWLMGQVALGKRQFLAPLVRRHASSLLTYIERMIGDKHRAEELFQEVLLSIWLKRGQYKFPKTFRSWLYAIATNRCRADFRRRKAVTVSFDETASELPVAAEASPVDAAVATETGAMVATALTRLPQQQRTVLVLRVWNGLSYAEIAESMGKSEGTVRSHMHHGLASLRKFLESRL